MFFFLLSYSTKLYGITNLCILRVPSGGCSCELLSVTQPYLHHDQHKHLLSVLGWLRRKSPHTCIITLCFWTLIFTVSAHSRRFLHIPCLETCCGFFLCCSVPGFSLSILGGFIYGNSGKTHGVSAWWLSGSLSIKAVKVAGEMEFALLPLQVFTPLGLGFMCVCRADSPVTARLHGGLRVSPFSALSRDGVQLKTWLPLEVSAGVPGAPVRCRRVCVWLVGSCAIHHSPLMGSATLM